MKALKIPLRALAVVFTLSACGGGGGSLADRIRDQIVEDLDKVAQEHQDQIEAVQTAISEAEMAVQGLTDQSTDSDIAEAQAKIAAIQTAIDDGNYLTDDEISGFSAAQDTLASDIDAAITSIAMARRPDSPIDTDTVILEPLLIPEGGHGAISTTVASNTFQLQGNLKISCDIGPPCTIISNAEGTFYDSRGGKPDITRPLMSGIIFPRIFHDEELPQSPGGTYSFFHDNASSRGFWPPISVFALSGRGLDDHGVDTAKLLG